jgi:predicted nuclease of restriction endonuclease-like (RecB) superfamily
MTKQLDKTEYKKFFIEIKERIHKAQYDALRSVNKELIQLYWDIGKKIVEKQSALGWGKSVVETLSSDLQKEFPGIRGFSPANLWRIWNFYSEYSNNLKLAPMVREIGWAHNVIIIEKCKDDPEKAFYINMTKKFGWTKNVLKGHFDPDLSGEKSYISYSMNKSFHLGLILSTNLFFFSLLHFLISFSLAIATRTSDVSS